MMGIRKVYGGIAICDADYVVQVKRPDKEFKDKVITVWQCPFYTRWFSMLRRCYSAAYHKRQPTYIGCTVCKEWLLFSSFKAWMETQDWEGKELDKDILVQGNKVYSPETCVFVSRVVNTFVKPFSGNTGEFPRGVYWNKNTKKFIAQCENPFTKKKVFLGCFNNVDEAAIAYSEYKFELAKFLAETCKDVRVAKVLIEMFKV